ncbi:hypothetical protein CAL26_14850 [Bordetella genomosp. 9]|uniref:Uncharacterized protein n=1 Tax=Bordetella genomosp. 9 TaxID=1416803 RepID=A0A261R2J7_9BORD|nr:hypothetical protein [Bordetella genomosp. 9]OZI18947.1 hypothetical protein CAL26_14850 [Bordetella genomosp. 9]
MDWNAVLGPAPNSTNEIYYDGLTLRNAYGKPLDKVVQVMETRIAKALRARGVGDAARLARELRRTATADPTLALHPPPDVAYGSPRWVALWTGLHTLSEQGLPTDGRNPDDLVEIGRAAIAVRAAKDETTAERNPLLGIDMGGLLLMAHAAGKLDLRSIADGKAELRPETLTDFYKEAFSDDLRLLDALCDLARLTPPTGKQLATENLRAARIDPELEIDVDTLALPAAYGPLELTIPLPFAYKRQSIVDFYVSRERLDLNVPPTPTRGEATPTIYAAPGPVTQARARLANSLKDEFDRAYDKYTAAAAGHVARIIDASISRYGKRHGIDAATASITVGRAQWRSKTSMPSISGGPLTPDLKKECQDARGYFIDIGTPTGRHRYFLPLATGAEVPVPTGASLADWIEDHHALVFGAQPQPPAEGVGGRIMEEILLSSSYDVKQLASGKQTELGRAIEAALPATLEQKRADAYGSSIIETVRELERGLVPFRGTYLAIRDERYDDLATSILLDSLVFLPCLGEGMALGMRAGEALAAGLEKATAAYVRSGLMQAFKAALGETGSRIPGLGWQAGKLLWNVGRSATFNPMDILALARGGGRLTAKGLRAVVGRLKGARPELAAELAEAANKLRRPLPAAVLQRYRIADTTVTQTLAKARAAEDGTIMLGARRYANVDGNYVELVLDHPLSTPGQPVWRIADAPLPGTRGGAPRLMWDKARRVWREPDDLPFVKGGGAGHSTGGASNGADSLTRKVDDDAVKALRDRRIADPTEVAGMKILGRTETVQTTEQVLREATDLTHYPWWEEELDQYFSISVVGLKDSAYARIDTSLVEASNAARMEEGIADNMRGFLHGLYARSETFRGLANRARATGRIRKGTGWFGNDPVRLKVHPPSTLKDGQSLTTIDMNVKLTGGRPTEINVPDVHAPPFAPNGKTSGIMLSSGKEGAVPSPSVIVHEMMHVLTGKIDPVGDSNAERGVVEYLAQRVLDEAGIAMPKRLSYSRLGSDYKGDDVRRLQYYVKTQDDFLNQLFPRPVAPPAPWDPGAGYERWLTVNTA